MKTSKLKFDKIVVPLLACGNETPVYKKNVGFEVLTAVTINIFTF
jgi:hypothetical protein